ncbi:MAG: hypothetical protein HYY16_19350 [Planctomycetes bacterium]|nr:hypothetical protein [Planctomycetota bacterium]
MEGSETSDNASRLRETMARLVHDWAEFARAACHESEQFIREKPMTGAAVAFVAGWVLASILQKR